MILVQILPFSNRKSAPKTGHHIGSKQGNIPITHYFAKQPLRVKRVKQPLRALKLNQTAHRMENNQSRKNPYLLEHRKNSRKSYGHFLNPKPLISRTPRLNPWRNLVFLVPTRSPRRVDELLFLARRIPTDGTLWIEERSFDFSFFFSLPLSLYESSSLPRKKI